MYVYIYICGPELQRKSLGLLGLLLRLFGLFSHSTFLNPLRKTKMQHSLCPPAGLLFQGDLLVFFFGLLGLLFPLLLPPRLFGRLRTLGYLAVSPSSSATSKLGAYSGHVGSLPC